MGKGAQLHGSRMLDGLCHLVHAIVGTSPVQDSHPEQVDKNQIMDMSLINLSEPFRPSNHVCPKMIVEEEI